MPRARNRARKVRLGFPLENFKSKTSKCFLEGRKRRDQEYKPGKPYPCRHTARTKLKASLAESLGLPEDTVFIFRESSEDRKEGKYLKRIKLHHGTTVVHNKKDTSLVLAVRCTEFEKMNASEREDFRFGISTPFLHARARLTLTLHRAIQLFVAALLLWGWMGCCGWRAGSDPGKSFGVYALSAFTSAKKERVEEDCARMEEFHKPRDFWAERFATLCFAAFESNVQLASKSKIPGFHQSEWQTTPNGSVFALNLVVTCDGFRNTPHKDEGDHTRYSFGMFSRIDRQTGEPYQLKGSKPRGDVKSASFIMEEFGIEVDFDGCDGVVEMVWDTRSIHYSTRSCHFDGDGKRLTKAKDFQITRFGSSCQISESLVERIQILEIDGEGMSEDEWLILVKERVKSYEDELNKKSKEWNQETGSKDKNGNVEVPKANVTKKRKRK